MFRTNIAKPDQVKKKGWALCNVSFSLIGCMCFQMSPEAVYLVSNGSDVWKSNVNPQKPD